MEYPPVREASSAHARRSHIQLDNIEPFPLSVAVNVYDLVSFS
jgi:hypothetical protein